MMLDAVNKFVTGMSITGTLGIIGVVCIILAAVIALRARSIKRTCLIAGVGALAAMRLPRNDCDAMVDPRAL